MIQLTKDKIAVTPIYDPDMIGSIYVPDQAKERVDQGIVKYIGPEVQDLKVGDYVLFSGYTGTLVQLEDEGQLIIFPEEFATCIVHPPATDIPGLYFRDSDGDYYVATHEMAFELIARAMQDDKWRIGLSAVDRKTRQGRSKKQPIHELPSPSDYEKWK